MSAILIIDDSERNRELLQAYLRRTRHRVLSADSGRAALALARVEAPDVAVLDLDMPDLDGLQTLRELKRQSAEEYLPVILIVPFGDLETRLDAWQAGADEVLVKPIHREELLVRIENLLALRAERLAMARTNRELLRLQEFKTSLDQLLVHDLKNPLAALSANLEYLGQEVPAESQPNLVEAVEDARRASRRLQRMVASILDVTAFEEGVLAPRRGTVELLPLLAGLQRAHRQAAQERGLTVEVECDAAIEIDVDKELFTRAVENLIEAALRRSTAGSHVVLGGRREGDRTRVTVSWRGYPIPDEMRVGLFDKYGALDAREGQPRVGVGLGLYFCRLAVEAHGGRVSLDDVDPAAFTIELPLPHG